MVVEGQDTGAAERAAMAVAAVIAPAEAVKVEA